MNKPKLYIMRGLPGSGKTTLASSLEGAVRLSTDQYWERPDGRYDFNPSLLSDAHEWAKVRAKGLMSIGRHKFDLNLPSCDLIIDNTNIKVEHMRPYLELAEQYGYEPVTLQPMTPWAWEVEECAKRNIHGVPLETIQRMKDQFEPFAL